jgi:hypothetical protein
VCRSAFAGIIKQLGYSDSLGMWKRPMDTSGKGF